MGSKSKEKFLKLWVVLGLLVIVAYLFRRIPWAGFSYEVSHFFVGHYSAIELTVESGFIPPKQSYPGITNWRVFLRDQWFRLAYFPVIFEVLGLENRNARLTFLQLFTIPPLLIAFGSLMIIGRKPPIGIRVSAFVFPLFVGQVAIARSNHGLYDWGFGAAFFIWAIAGLVIGIRQRAKFWFLLTPVFGVFVFASRHTAGLLLIFSLVFIALGSILFRLESRRRIVSSIGISVIVLTTINALIFVYLRNVLSWGIIEISQALFYEGSGGGGGGGGTSETLSVSGALTPEVTFVNILSVIDRLLIIALLTVALVIWLASTPPFRRLFSDSLSIDNAKKYAILSISIFITSSLSLGLITFYFFKGMAGIINRGEMYLTLYGLISIPILLLVSGSITTNITTNIDVRRFIVIILIISAIISPFAYLTSDKTTNASPWLSTDEGKSISTLRDNIPRDSRIVGSFHAAPPFIYTHPCVVGPDWSLNNGEYITVLNGLYYQVNPSSFNNAVQIMEEKYGEISVFVVSERVNNGLGVHTLARHPGPAPKSVFMDYSNLRGINHVYSGGIHVYTTGNSPSCNVNLWAPFMPN